MDPATGGEGQVDRLRLLAERVVERVFGRRRPRLTLTAMVGDPAQTILREGRGADLIVLSTQGRTGLAHFVIGSVAERVVRHSVCPVMTVRP